MSSKSKKSVSKTPEVVAPEVVAPVVAAPVVAAPVVAAHVVVAPVVAAPVVVAPVVAAPDVVAQKGGKKKATKAVVEPVVEPVVETQKKGGAKKAAVKKTPKVEASETPVVAQTQEGGKPKRTRKPKAPVVETPVETEGDAEDGKLVRSFKVKLPDNENFVGRFTGLTPYQAANKALSKYFRETKNADKEITFLICESTRKSKKSVYTYIGKRYQLEVPVRYKIQDGREIVKNFKNSLKKVKKIDVEQAGGAAVMTPVVAPAAPVVV